LLWIGPVQTEDYVRGERRLAADERAVWLAGKRKWRCAAGRNRAEGRANSDACPSGATGKSMVSHKQRPVRDLISQDCNLFIRINNRYALDFL
jgi:hypothetical protein